MFRTDLSPDSGFTLVELMVVVLIIGILVAIAIPVFSIARANAQLRTCQSNQRTIESAVQAWRAEATSNDPSTFGNTNVAAGTGSGNVLIPRFLKDFPRCPAGNGQYHLDAVGITVDGDTSAVGWWHAGQPDAHRHF